VFNRIFQIHGAALQKPTHQAIKPAAAEQVYVCKRGNFGGLS
jgi:hypothetical protein